MMGLAETIKVSFKMSCVTNVILCLEVLDADGPHGKIVEVNRFFGENGTGLVSVDDPSLPKGWYGGSKYLEAEVYVAAFNGFDLDGFIEHLRSIEWECPEAVQLLIKEQEDERFRLINVMDNLDKQENHK